MMEFNPLFLNINNQIGSSGDLKLNKFGNLSYLFKDIIKIKMEGIAGDNGLESTSQQNSSENNLIGGSQISINEDELKNLIETLLAKIGNLSGDISETGETKKSKSKKEINGSNSSVDLNTIISQIEAGKTIKLNFTDTEENYSIEISKANESAEININSNSPVNETIDTSVLNIQSPKLLFALKNQIAAKAEQTTSNSLVESVINQNTSEEVQASTKVLDSNPGNIETVSTGNTENINLNSNQTENLFKELKSLIENRETQPELTNKTDEVNFKIKIVKHVEADSQTQNIDTKAANKTAAKAEIINTAAENNEKIFEVKQKLHTEAQNDFKQLENQNGKISKLNYIPTKEAAADDTKNNDSAVKENLKTLPQLDDISVGEKSEKKEISRNLSENKLTDNFKAQSKLNSEETIKENESNYKSSTKLKDAKEIKNDSKIKNTQQSEVKISPDNKEQTTVKIQDVKEAKSDTGFKTIQNSNPKEQSSFNQQTSDQQQNYKDSKPSYVIENSTDKNVSSKEIETDNSNEKIDSQKIVDSQFNAELKNIQNSDVKETRQGQTFDNQPKIIKPSQILNEISSFIRKGEVRSLVLKLTPENLGKVKVEVNMVDKAMHANIEVENESVKQTIQSNFNQLRTALVQSGITVAGLTISLNNGGEKNTKASEPKRKTSVNSQAIKTEEKSTVTIPKKMGYNTYEYLA